MRTKSAEKMTGILSFVNWYYSQNGYSPSIREIANHIGLSATSTLDYLNDMNERGLLIYNGERRSIATPSMKRERLNRIPLLGEVACIKTSARLTATHLTELSFFVLSCIKTSTRPAVTLDSRTYFCGYA